MSINEKTVKTNRNILSLHVTFVCALPFLLRFYYHFHLSKIWSDGFFALSFPLSIWSISLFLFRFEIERGWGRRQQRRQRLKNFRPNQGSSPLSSPVRWLRPAKVLAFQVSSPLTTLSGERSLCQKPTNLILLLIACLSQYEYDGSVCC